MALPLSIRFICVGYLKCTAEPNHNLTHLFLASNVDQLFGPNLFWTLLVFRFCCVCGLLVDMALRSTKSWVSGKLSQIISRHISGFDISIEAVQIKKFRSALNLSTLGGTSFNQSYLNCILVSTKLDHSFYKKTCVLRRFSSIYNSQ